MSHCRRSLAHRLRRRWQQFLALMLRGSLISYCVEYPGACESIAVRYIRPPRSCCPPGDTQ